MYLSSAEMSQLKTDEDSFDCGGEERINRQKQKQKNQFGVSVLLQPHLSKRKSLVATAALLFISQLG